MWNIPSLGHKENEVAEFRNILLRGVTDLRDTLHMDEVAVTAKAADLNLVAGLAVGAITTGLVKYFEKEITCANGSAQAGTVVTLPKGAVILEVATWCTEAFNGDATTTFEVGVTANTDKYIDPVDCPVTLDGMMNMMGGTNNDQKVTEILAADTAILYLYTNTATATKGKMKVRVIYA